MAIVTLVLGWAVGPFELESLMQADGHAEVAWLDDGSVADESNAMYVGDSDVRS